MMRRGGRCSHKETRNQICVYVYGRHLDFLKDSQSYHLSSGLILKQLSRCRHGKLKSATKTFLPCI